LLFGVSSPVDNHCYTHTSHISQYSNGDVVSLETKSTEKQQSLTSRRQCKQADTVTSVSAAKFHRPQVVWQSDVSSQLPVSFQIHLSYTVRPASIH